MFWKARAAGNHGDPSARAPIDVMIGTPQLLWLMYP